MTIEYLLYEGGYIACMLATLTGAGALWLSRRHLPKTEPVLVAIGAFTAWPCLVTIIAPAMIISPLRAFTAIGLAGAYLTARSLPRAWLERGLRYIGAAVAAVVIAEVIFTLGGRPTFLANPNMTASWLLLCWPWMPWWLAVAGVGATQSRAAIAGLAISGLAVLLLRSHLGGRARLALVAATALITPWAAYLRWATVQDRLLTWALGIRLFLARPLAGWGLGASAMFNRDHFDSAPLTISVEMGVVGLITFGVLLAGLACLAWRSPSPARWALLALAIQNIADDTWLWPVTAVLLGITLALVEATHDDLRLVPADLLGALHRFGGHVLRPATDVPEAEGLVGSAPVRDPAERAAGPESVLGGGGREADHSPGRVPD